MDEVPMEMGPSLSTLQKQMALGSGAFLLLVGASQRRLPRLCLMAAAAPMLFRGVTGHWPQLVGSTGSNGDTRAALAQSRGIHVRDAIRLEVPIDEVYWFWRHVENLPRFMDHLVSVTDTGDGRSHWVARGPAGVRVEWDAEIINEVEHQVIGWRSLPGSDVVSAGSVNFDRVRGGRGTQVTVHLQYAPPAGRAGAFLATLFGREPSQTVREDLRRMKQLLEAGELARAGTDAAERKR